MRHRVNVNIAKLFSLSAAPCNTELDFCQAFSVPVYRYVPCQVKSSSATLPTGSIVVPFCGLYLGSYKVIPNRNYYGASGYGTHDNRSAAFARDQKHFFTAGNEITFVKQPVELLSVPHVIRGP